MRPAARVGDFTAHGSILGPGPGSQTVLIEGAPAWRAATDMHTCPLLTGNQPHVGGTVATGSPSVLIEGFPAARVGDSIVERGGPNTIAMGSSTVLIGSATEPVHPEWAIAVYEQLAAFRARYNREIGTREERFLAGQIAGEIANIHIATAHGEMVVSVPIADSMRLGELSWGSRDDATVRVETNDATIEELDRAEDPAGGLREAVESGGTQISGIGPVNSLKWTLVDGLRRVGQFL